MSARESFPEALTGVWQMVRAEFDGERAHELVTSNTTLLLADGRYEVRFDREIADGGTVELVTSADVATLVFSGESGTNAGKIIRSIYQIRGNSLRICHGLEGVAPDGFVTSSGSRRYLATFRRIS